MNIDAAEWIKTAPAGTMAYARQTTAPGTSLTTGFLIREEVRHVESFGKDPVIELRCGAFEQNGVLLVVVLAKVGGEMYETWLNYHQTGGGAQYFRDLLEQETIHFAFFTPEPTKMVSIRNRTGDFFKQALGRAVLLKAWSMRDFDAAREKVYARYPTVAKLWKEIK